MKFSSFCPVLAPSTRLYRCVTLHAAGIGHNIRWCSCCSWRWCCCRCTGLRGTRLAESRVAWFTELSDLQSTMGVERSRSERCQVMPWRLLAELHQPIRDEHQQRAVWVVRVGIKLVQLLIISRIPRSPTYCSSDGVKWWGQMDCECR